MLLRIPSPPGRPDGAQEPYFGGSVVIAVCSKVTNQ
jgi:hypothetical protein